MLQIGVCDDDLIFLERAKGCLKALLQERNMEGEIHIFENVEQLKTYIEEGKTLNILFLDIVFQEFQENAKGGNGIFIGKNMNRMLPRCQIVFVTNYDEYCMDVYEVEHRGFIVKTEFEKRLNRTFEILFEQKKLVTFTCKGKSITYAMADICYAERGRRISKIVPFDVTREDGQVINQSFEEVCRQLSGKNFVRCHNGYVVNLCEVKTYMADGFLMNNGEFIAISRKYRNPVRDRFLEWQQEWL